MVHTGVRSRLAAGLAVVSIVVTACGNAAVTNPPATGQASVPATSTPGTSTAPSEAAATPAASIPQGGTLSIAWNSDIQYFDPAKGYDVVSWPAERLMFETLLTYDSGTKLVPLLATDMPTVTNGGKTYTFKLRTGVNFVNPDGSVAGTMTADDVVDSINREIDPKFKPSASPVNGAFFGGKIVGAQDVIDGKATTASGIKKIDSQTVEFDLVNADATFMNIMATPFASIVPKGTVHDATAFGAKPVGTGPYTLKSYTKGTQATFVANKHYWQAGQPYLDEIDFKVGVDDNAAIQQIQAGTLDLMGDALPSGSFTQITTDPTYKDQIVTHTLVNTDYLFFDTQQPASAGPLGNVKVRQALEYAIDKDNIIKLVHGAGVKADCILPPDMPGFDPTCKPYSYDPVKAKQMLTDAGFPNGFTSTLYTDTTDPDPAIAQALQQDLAAVGVTVNVVTEEFATFLDRIETPHKAAMGYVGWFQDYPDPSDFFDPLLSCVSAVQGGANASLECNKAADTLAAQALGETDQAKRLQEYDQVQTMHMADAPWVPIRHQVWFTLESKRVGGFAIHPVWQYDLRSVWIKPGS
ncbi:MAG TPA: ABC transporter substrate-binding protein [Candidatus Acidoferrum sp.]|nr:ABC transporter substrate-binding protein [Candidatus Acidoferrum sp.]